MTNKEAKQLKHGLYRLFWKSGGSSLASVGSLYDGTKWFAPTNWTSKETGGIASVCWKLIDCVEIIEDAHTKL